MARQFLRVPTVTAPQYRSATSSTVKYFLMVIYKSPNRPASFLRVAKARFLRLTPHHCMTCSPWGPTEICNGGITLQSHNNTVLHLSDLKSERSLTGAFGAISPVNGGSLIPRLQHRPLRGVPNAKS